MPVDSAAKVVGVHPNAVRSYIAAGELGYRNMRLEGSSARRLEVVSVDALRALLERQGTTKLQSTGNGEDLPSAAAGAVEVSEIAEPSMSAPLDATPFFEELLGSTGRQLLAAGIFSLADLYQTDAKRLLAIPGLGKGSLRTIAGFLKANNLPPLWSKSPSASELHAGITGSRGGLTDQRRKLQDQR